MNYDKYFSQIAETLSKLEAKKGPGSLMAVASILAGLIPVMVDIRDALDGIKSELAEARKLSLRR